MRVNCLRRLNRVYDPGFAQYDLSPPLVHDADRLDWMTDDVSGTDPFRRIERYL